MWSSHLIFANIYYHKNSPWIWILNCKFLDGKGSEENEDMLGGADGVWIFSDGLWNGKRRKTEEWSLRLVWEFNLFHILTEVCWGWITGVVEVTLFHISCTMNQCSCWIWNLPRWTQNPAAEFCTFLVPGLFPKWKR